MKKNLFIIIGLIIANISLAQTPFWTKTNYKGAFPVTDGTLNTDWTSGWANFDPQNTNYPTTTSELSSDVTSDLTISGSVLLKNKVYVRNGATITILPGTTIRGDRSTQACLIITRGSKIIAQGTKTQPIVFTSNESVGNRTEGDWGGLVLLGRAINNQPGGEANIEGITPTENTRFGGSDDNDNSGILNYIRIEFAGIALEPNKEINGITFGSVGRGTQVDFIQVSYSGDDSYEWFGGSVDCKHLIAYSGIDDDFDTDFGYHGRVQFALSIRSKDMSDAAGDSNGFESDNDATGSSGTPVTSAVFSNVTLVGPKLDGSVALPSGEKFEKAFRLRRNTSLSVLNTVVVGWEKGLSIEGASSELNVSSKSLVFANNTISGLNAGANCVTATSTFYSSFFGQNSNDTLTTPSQIKFVRLSFNNPDLRLSDTTSLVASGADFTSEKFIGGFTTGLNVIKQKETLNIYPNPSSGSFTVDSKVNQDVQIYNSNGQLIHTSRTNQVIDLNMVPGIYFIRTLTNTQKLIITN